MPTVSVIIPNYNHAIYLRQRIDTVLSQTFQDFEVIILDDNSTDSSKEIIEQYRENPKINKVIFNEKNSGGVFKQWIKGIEAATGEFIWIAESDDYSSGNFLEETVKTLRADKTVGMVFTASTTVNEDGNYITTTEKTKHHTFAQLKNAGNIIDNKNMPNFLIAEMVIENASSVLFRKSALLNLDFNELAMFKNTGDRFVYIGIALQSKIYYIPKFCNFMRSHQKNTTKQNLVNGNLYRDRMRVLNYYFDHILKCSPNLKPIADFYKTDVFFFINFCTYQENLQLLNNVKKTKQISGVLYYLVKYYLYLFKKRNFKARIFRSIYYRILLLQLEK